MEKTDLRETVSFKAAVLVILAAAVVFAFILGNVVGTMDISVSDIIDTVSGNHTGTNNKVIWNIRLPRMILAALVGINLALSGSILQGVMKNPLADPSIIGISSGAGLFGIVILVIFPQWQNFVPIAAFGGAMLAAAIIYLLAWKGGIDPTRIVLSGVAVSAIFQAGTTLIQYFASDTQVASAVYWTFGDLGRASYKTDLIMFIVVAVSTLFFFLKRWDFSAMSGGIAYAKTLGVNTRFMTIMSLLLASLITSVTVSFLGIIGFVGLTAPQFMKRIVGDDYRYLLPSSFLAGALLLLISDILGRLPIFGTSVPVGVVTSLIGGPVFLAILLRRKKNESENI